MSKAETFEGVGSKLHAAWHKAAMGDGSQLVQMRSRQVRKAHEKISGVRHREAKNETSRAAGGSSAVRRPS